MTDRIMIDPRIQHGRPVIRGTRVPIVRLLGGLAGGMSVDEVCREYDVTQEDMRSALVYAIQLIEEEEHHALPTNE